MKPRIYLETTIPSYLTAWPSRDLVRAAHQQITRDHIANATLRDPIESVCRENGYEPPAICTPDELLAEEGD